MALKISEAIKHRNRAGGTDKPSRAQILAQRGGGQRPQPAAVAPAQPPVKRDSLSSLKSPVGEFGLFNICSDADLISLSFQGVDTFIDWLGFSLTNILVQKRGFIAWNRPEYNSGSVTAGWLADPCGDANGVDFGVCDFTVSDFARLRRHGPTRDITMNNVNYCATEPRRRLDGTTITDVREYDMRLAMEAILTDFRRMLITGNKSTAGQFDGLQRLIKTGYTNSDGTRCELMDSIVVNWNNNGVAGGNGITLNGAAVSNTASLVDMLLYIHQTIKARIAASPSLSAQQMRPGDRAIVMPTSMIRCLLDSFTCWSVCAGAQYREVNLNTYEARNFRNNLNGGQFGFGHINLDGDDIPLIGYDYGTMSGGVVKAASITRASTTATLTTVLAHGLTTGDSVTISGATAPEYNGTFTVTVTGATTFTYTVTGTPTSPDPSTNIYVTIPSKGDIYYLVPHVGNVDLIEVEALDMGTAPDVANVPSFDVLDGGRYLTWTNNDNTCVTRNVEFRPRLVAWAPWAQARIQNFNCSTLGPLVSMDPTSLAFPVKTFTSAT